MQLVLYLPKNRLDHLLTVIVRKGGPRGTQLKKLQNWDSKAREVGVLFLHGYPHRPHPYLSL
jgi:hypothetical protein